MWGGDFQFSTDNNNISKIFLILCSVAIINFSSLFIKEKLKNTLVGLYNKVKMPLVANKHVF